ncbi:MAG: HAD-IA family hydrolase [bacterium]
MTQKKIKAIVFDLDGTIADTFHIGIQAANALAGKYKYQPIQDSPVIRDMSFKEFLSSHLKLGKIRLILWAREIRRLISQRYDDVKIFPGIREMLKELNKEYKVGILTSNSTQNTLKILEGNDVGDLFSFMYTNCSAFGKYRHLRKLIKTEKLKREDIIYVGDEIRDIDSCRKAGVSIIAVTWGANSVKTLKQAPANHYAYKPWDIVDILNAL